MRRFLPLGLLLLLVTGCTSAVTLRHPITGVTVKCGPYAFDNLGRSAAVAMERERQCISDYQRQGYERGTVPGQNTPGQAVDRAWVMWVRAAPATSSGEVVGAWTSWATYGAYTTRAGCIAYVPDGLPQVKDVAQQATGLVTEGYVRADFQCLPGTIDPRGPKAQ